MINEFKSRLKFYYPRWAWSKTNNSKGLAYLATAIISNNSTYIYKYNKHTQLQKISTNLPYICKKSK